MNMLNLRTLISATCVSALAVTSGSVIARTSVSDLENEINGIKTGQTEITPRVGDVASDCVAEGQLRWNANEEALQVCDGTEWATILDTNLDFVEKLTELVCANAENGRIEDIPSYCTSADQNYYVFVTSNRYTGALGGLYGADAKCQSEANNSDLPGLYKAWLSTSNSSPYTDASFTKAGEPYVRPDGVSVADDFDDLTDGGLANPINRTATESTNNSPVWSHTYPNGSSAPSSYHCSNWTSTNGGGIYGNSSRTDGAWTYLGTAGCSNSYSLYCFRQ
jgi:hypothetical protein